MSRSDVGIDIWSSCVTRDSLYLGGQDVGFQINSYFWNNSFPVQFTEHILPPTDLADYQKHINGKMPQRCAWAEWNREIIPALESSGSEWLVIDSRPYAYGYVGIQAADMGGEIEYFTRYNFDSTLAVLKEKGIVSDQTPILQIPYDDPAIESGMNRFMQWAKNRYGRNIILVEFFESMMTLHDDGTMVWDEGPDSERLAVKSKIVSESYFNSIFQRNTSCYVVRSPFNVSCDALHKWGHTPVHYVREFYKYVYDAVYAITDSETSRQVTEARLMSLYLDCTYRMSRIASGDVLSLNNAVTRSINLIKDNKPEIAWKTLRKLSEDGNDPGYAIMADFFETGSGKNLEPSAIFPLLDKFQGHGRLMPKLMFDLISERGTDQELETLVGYLKSQAEMGDAKSASVLQQVPSSHRRYETGRTSRINQLRNETDRSNECSPL